MSKRVGSDPGVVVCLFNWGHFLMIIKKLYVSRCSGLSKTLSCQSLYFIVKHLWAYPYGKRRYINAQLLLLLLILLLLLLTWLLLLIILWRQRGSRIKIFYKETKIFLCYTWFVNSDSISLCYLLKHIAGLGINSI